MCFKGFGLGIKLEADELEVPGVHDEATLEVCVQYLRRSTVLGEGRRDEFDDDESGVVDPDTMATCCGLGDPHALREIWAFPIPQTLHSGQGQPNTQVARDSRRIRCASHGMGDNSIAAVRGYSRRPPLGRECRRCNCRARNRRIL